MRGWMISFGVATAVLVVGALLLDEGEVVHLETTDREGRHYEADLWIVDLDGVSYLRANDGDLGWLERLRENPRVSIERGTVDETFVATPLEDPRLRSRVDGAVREKYGLADRVMELMSEPDQYVVVGLVPEAVEARPRDGS